MLQGNTLLPGVRINFESTRTRPLTFGVRGTVLLPLIGHSYGPAKEFITINGRTPNSEFFKLGYSISEDVPSMLLIREALKNALTVVAYIPNQGARATMTEYGLVARARYGGARGNDLRVTVTTNPINGFNVLIHLGNTAVSSYEGLLTIGDLIAQNDGWIEFAGEAGEDLVPFAGRNLAGGVTGTTTTGDISEFLRLAEPIHWNAMAFPIEDTASDALSLYTMVVSQIKHLRDIAGKPRIAVIPAINGLKPDHEGIISVKNSVVVDGVALTTAQVTAWVAGADSGALPSESNTYKTYDGATDIVGRLDGSEEIASANNGEFFFAYSEANEIVVRQDINSLVTFEHPKDETYRLNRTRRSQDALREAIHREFPPNKFDNSPDHWSVMEGLGRSILLRFEEARIIKNVDVDNDFRVDRERSGGESTTFIVGYEQLLSSEKLFFTVKTR